MNKGWPYGCPLFFFAFTRCVIAFFLVAFVKASAYDQRFRRIPMLT